MIEVGLIDHMGTDDTVVDAARVSFSKQASMYSKEQNIKLIEYLAKYKHTSPFGHCFVSFRVRAPVFVARQLVKHRFLRWNETSRRYVDDEPEMFMPDKWRAKADNVKQGSREDLWVEDIPYGFTGTQLVSEAVQKLYDHALDLYDTLIDSDVAPEQARMVLPQSMMTEWIWSGSLDAFASMCKLRLDPHTQYESRLVAEAISKEMSVLFPHSWENLLRYVD
jgi:thymidylate synthase (FAD)